MVWKFGAENFFGLTVAVRCGLILGTVEARQ